MYKRRVVQEKFVHDERYELGEFISSWGWDRSKGALVPTYMTQPPAPDNVSKMIFCTCKTGRGCCKTGLFCSSACTECTGTSCLNCLPLVDDDELSTDDEEEELKRE